MSQERGCILQVPHIHICHCSHKNDGGTSNIHPPTGCKAFSWLGGLQYQLVLKLKPNGTKLMLHTCLIGEKGLWQKIGTCGISLGP